MSPGVAYMTGEYPRATDTFIQREVAALRERGVHVQTFSVRRPADKEIVGPEQHNERQRTRYLLPARPLGLLWAHLSLLFAGPARYLSAVKLALTTRPPGLKALARQLAYFAEAGLVARAMQTESLAHLHNHFSNSSCSVAMLASELGGFPFSFTMHGPAEFFEPKYWRLDQKIRRAKFVCCISHFCRSQGMIFAPPDKWDRMHVVHCGVDAASYEPVRHEGRGNRLLFVGRLAPVKGVPVLLESLAILRREHPDVVLTLAGDGPDRQFLERRAAELGLQQHARFLGYQSQSQVRRLLRETDVFVSSSFAEGVPVVLMEAMAAGVPVVATRIAGVPELVDDGVCGWLVPPGDPGALADKIDMLLADAHARTRFALAGRQKVEQEFDLAAESQRLCQILTDALEGRVAPIRPEAQSAPPTNQPMGVMA